MGCGSGFRFGLVVTRLAYTSGMNSIEVAAFEAKVIRFASEGKIPDEVLKGISQLSGSEPAADRAEQVTDGRTEVVPKRNQLQERTQCPRRSPQRNAK